MTTWQRLRAWRRSRPFWGGVLTILAGLVIIGSMHLEPHGDVVSIGQHGFSAYLIAFVLIAAGPLAWLAQAQRQFYGLVATFTAVFALLSVNLGGFFLGTLLGVIGGGLMFAWSPAPADPPVAKPSGTEPANTEPAMTGSAGTEPASSEPVVADPAPTAGEPAGRDSVSRGPASEDPARSEAEPGEQPAGERQSAQTSVVWRSVRSGVDGISGRHAALTGIALLIGVSGLAGGPGPAAATPCPAQPSPGGGLLGRLPWLGISTPSPSPAALPCPSPPALPSVPELVPPQPSVTPSAGTPQKVFKPAAGQPDVAKRPSRMTGSRVTMRDLVYDGVYELPTVDGPVRVLRFSMSRSDTDRFLLHVHGRAGWDLDLRSSRLTVEGDRVRLYTSRFQGRLFGMIPVDYTPDTPPPPIPLSEVFFTDPVVQLMWVEAPVLRGPDLRTVLVRS